jgi:long-chain acyl-CoA synthetase
MEALGPRSSARGKSFVKLCAGAPLSAAQKANVLATWQGAFWDLYGQTETGTLTLLALHSSPEEKFGSVGRALPSVVLRILDDAGNVMPEGEEGEIAGHSTTLMTGYHGQQAANEATLWKDGSGRLYIRTGDIGKIDAEGYLWLCDRKKDMIKSGGANVYPADIERTLQDHPAVLEAAVVGFESPRWGESPVAFLTLRNGAIATEEEIKTWVNSRVGPIQRVAAVKILTELPSGSMGKILKRQLRLTYANAVGPLP